MKDELNGDELDAKIWVVNGLAYHMREEFVSENTRSALDAYQDAQKQQIPWKVKYYGALHRESVTEDLLKAMILLRNGE